MDHVGNAVFWVAITGKGNALRMLKELEYVDTPSSWPRIALSLGFANTTLCHENAISCEEICYS